MSSVVGKICPSGCSWSIPNLEWYNDFRNVTLLMVDDRREDKQVPSVFENNAIFRDYHK